MNPQQLHDALSHLPDDLLEETDRRRRSAKKAIPFRRYLSMAACFVLLASSGLILSRLIQPKGATETAICQSAEAAPAALAEESPVLPESAMDEIPAVECAPIEEAPAQGRVAGTQENRNSVTEASAFPVLALQTPRKTEGTASYSSDPRVTLLHSPEELLDYITHYDYQYRFGSTEAAVAAYDSSWFERHDLLLLAIHSVPVGSSCSITAFAETDGLWEIHVAHNAFVPPNTNTTDYHLFVTMEKGQIPDKNAVTLILDIQSQ